MDGTHTTFRRLSDEDLSGFNCYSTKWFTKHPAWKIGFFIMLGAVLIRWVTR